MKAPKPRPYEQNNALSYGLMGAGLGDFILRFISPLLCLPDGRLNFNLDAARRHVCWMFVHTAAETPSGGLILVTITRKHLHVHNYS